MAAHNNHRWQIGETAFADPKKLTNVKMGILLGLLKMTRLTSTGEQILDLNGKTAELCEISGVSRHAVYHCIDQMIASGVLLRGGRRGIYLINPYIFTAGTADEADRGQMAWAFGGTKDE